MTTVDAKEGRKDRLVQFLGRLLVQGFNQQNVAERVGVPPQYLSDIKCGRRSLGELVARRLAEEFNGNYQWLLWGQGSIAKPQVGGGPSPPAILLPVLDEALFGDAKASSAWDGSVVPVTGAGAATAQRSKSPYLLRIPFACPAESLCHGDILLISQSPVPTKKIVLLTTDDEDHGAAPRRAYLARRDENGHLVLLETDESPGKGVIPAGHAAGVVWRAL